MNEREALDVLNSYGGVFVAPIIPGFCRTRFELAARQLLRDGCTSFIMLSTSDRGAIAYCIRRSHWVPRSKMYNEEVLVCNNVISRNPELFMDEAVYIVALRGDDRVER